LTQSPKLEKCLNIEKKRQNVDKNFEFKQIHKNQNSDKYKFQNSIKKRQNVDKNFEFKQIHKNQNSDKYKFQNSSKNTNKNLPILDITKLVQ